MAPQNFLNILSLYFSLTLLLITFCYANNIIENNGCRFKGMFVFGSSVVDNGNNIDLINSTAKSNYLPYGVDFVDGQTGRASNGKTIADCIGDYIQLPLIPSFASTQINGDFSIIYGVNFASSGSGILNQTGSSLGVVITLNEQITNFVEVTLPELERQLNSSGEVILRDYMFLSAAGNNDYLYYFLMGLPHESPQRFASRVASLYYAELKRLYQVGARNFLLLSVYPLGCSPGISQGRGCLTEMNAKITMFYDQLINMVNQFKSVMPGSKFIVLNSVKAITSIIFNPYSSGFENVRDPCCEVTPDGSSCKVNGIVCNNRNSYAFFDGHHNTEALANAVALKVYNSVDLTEVYPINLQKFGNLPIKST